VSTHATPSASPERDAANLNIADDTADDTPQPVPMAAPEPGTPARPRKVMTRARILAAPDRRIVELRVPEWDDADGEAWVYLRSLSGAERDTFEGGVVVQRKQGNVVNYTNIRAKLCALVLVDGPDPLTASLLFAKPEDVPKLGEKNVAALQRIFNEAQRMNGISDADVQELVGN
jgi:hypothetical protein